MLFERFTKLDLSAGPGKTESELDLHQAAPPLWSIIDCLYDYNPLNLSIKITVLFSIKSVNPVSAVALAWRVAFLMLTLIDRCRDFMGKLVDK